MLKMMKSTELGTAQASRVAEGCKVGQCIKSNQGTKPESKAPDFYLCISTFSSQLQQPLLSGLNAFLICNAKLFICFPLKALQFTLKTLVRAERHQ
jgi:hypothetical protein